MRLTLRNMLAYLNNIIEDPAEIEELRRKIEESEFATGLVHRIRSATNRQKLGAPSLEGRGIGLDPNSVAEYLDNELPPPTGFLIWRRFASSRMFILPKSPRAIRFWHFTSRGPSRRMRASRIGSARSESPVEWSRRRPSEPRAAGRPAQPRRALNRFRLRP